MRDVIAAIVHVVDAGEHAQGGWGCVPDAHLLFGQNAEPTVGIETAGELHLGDAVQPRTDDSVGCARDPTVVGRAPVEIITFKLHDLGHAVRDVCGRAMHVLHALGLSRGAGGVVNQRWRLFIDPRRLELRRGSAHAQWQAQNVLPKIRVAVDDQDDLQCGQGGSDAFEPRQRCPPGDNARSPAIGQPIDESQVAEVGEERQHGGLCLKRTEEAGEYLDAFGHEDGDDFALILADVAKNIRELASHTVDLLEGVVTYRQVRSHQAQPHRTGGNSTSRPGLTDVPEIRRHVAGQKHSISTQSAVIFTPHRHGVAGLALRCGAHGGRLKANLRASSTTAPALIDGAS